jgi:hypothetical protein
MFACVGSFTTAQRQARSDGIHIYRLSGGRRDRMPTYGTQPPNYSKFQSAEFAEALFTAFPID